MNILFQLSLLDYFLS